MSCKECMNRSSKVFMSDVNHPIGLSRGWLVHAISLGRDGGSRSGRPFKFYMREEDAMSVERKEVGPRMSQIVIHGNTVYLAGVVAHAAKGKSVTEQTKEILATIDGHLAKAGTDKSKLLSANIWITDMAKFGEMNAAWDAWVSPGNTPARATVEAKLAAPEYNVEIMVQAAR